MPVQRIGRHLMESAPRPTCGAGSLFLSTGVHGVLITLSVWATLSATSKLETTREPIAVVDLSAFRPASVAPRARATQPRPATSRGFQVLSAPVDVPVSISLDDLKQPTTIPEDFTGTGAAGGFSIPIGAAPLLPLTGSGEPIDGSSADNPPYMMPGQMGPSYPPELRGEAPDGLVVVRFVIDTLGKVETSSVKVVESTHPHFLSSVRVALDRLRFTPAKLSGQRVRVRMEQRFEFHLSGR